MGESTGTQEGYATVGRCIRMLFKDTCIQADLFYTAGQEYAQKCDYSEYT